MLKKILTTKSARCIVLAYNKKYEDGTLTASYLKQCRARAVRNRAEKILACVVDEDIQSLAERFVYRY